MPTDADPIARITDLIDRFGADQYGNEAVTQQAHALQCAALAEAAGAAAPVIAAALLHDIGHLLDKHAALGLREEIDRQHEMIGAGWLARHFEPAVAEMVRLHVDAKRWLCHAEPGYAATLSPESVRSLRLQGGVFDAADAAAFRARPHAAEAIEIRRWDDLAKDPARTTPPLAHFLPALRACLRASAG